MPLLRSPLQTSTGTSSTAAIDAMRRTGAVSPTMANAPAPQTSLFGSNTNTAISGMAGAAAKPITTLLGPNGAAPVISALNPILQQSGASTVPTGAAPGAGAARINPAQQTTVAADTAANAAANGGAAATPPPRPDLVTPTMVDTSAQDKIYADRLAQSDKDRELMMNTGYNTISALQRRNASNAALAGFSVGGGSYLGGQRSAAVAGINAFNQGLLNWGQQRQSIYGQQAGLASNAASQNAASANQGGMFNAGREGSIADQKTAAQTTQNANQNLAAVDQVTHDFDYLFNDHNYKDGSGQYNSLLTTYKNSLTTGNAEEQAAAYQALMAYITPIQQAREQWVNSGGKDKNGDFQDWYKKRFGK